jgi:hypothetical protein
MFPFVETAGATFALIAAFSAGSPKLSQPIGESTFSPRIRR